MCIYIWPPYSVTIIKTLQCVYTALPSVFNIIFKRIDGQYDNSHMFITPFLVFFPYFDNRISPANVLD